MGWLKFGLCIVILISSVSKISGDSSRSLLHTEPECSEEDGVLQSGPCIHCICVLQKIVCVKVQCGLEDAAHDSVEGTESIAMYQKVRPPEIIVNLPNSPITNTIYEQPIQEEDLPDQVVAVSIMTNDDSQEDDMGIPITIEPYIPSVHKKEKNILDDLIAGSTPNDSSFLTETRVEDVLKTLLNSNNNNKNEKHLLIVPENFQSTENEFKKILPHTVKWQNILNNNFKTHSNRHDKVGTMPLLLFNKNKKGNLSPIMTVDGYGRQLVIPLARQPYAFARPGDKRLFMRPSHYMRNDDSPVSKKIKTFKYPWFQREPIDNIHAKGPEIDYEYDLLQNYPDTDLYSQYENVNRKWSFIKEKPKIDFKSSKKFKYPWFNHKPGGIDGPVDQSDRNNYYKLLQQYGDDDDLSSYYMNETPHKDHYDHQSHMYNNLIPGDHDQYNSNANADRYDRLSNKYEKVDIGQNLVLDDKEKEVGPFNISDDQQFIRPSVLGNDQAVYKDFNSSKTFKGMKQIPISYQLQGQSANEYPNPTGFEQNKYVNNLIPIGNYQLNIVNAYENKNQTALIDQLKWQDANGYSEILSSKEPKPVLEFNENLFGPANNQQIFNFLQQINNSSYGSKYSNIEFLVISQSLQKRPFISMSAIMPGQTQSGSNINNSNEQILLPNEFQLEQYDNAYFDGLSRKPPEKYQYYYKLPAVNLIQTFGNKKLVNYSSNDSKYTSNNYSNILYGQKNTPIISISEILPSDIQNENPGNANETKEDIVKQIKWLQDHDYIFKNKRYKPDLQTSSKYKLKPAIFNYLLTNSGYPKKQQKFTPAQFLLEYENKYPSMQNYEDHEPVDEYDEYGVIVGSNHQIFSNKPKVKDFNQKQNWQFFSQPKQQKSTFGQNKNWPPCGPNENCGYKLGKNIRPIPLSLVLGDSPNLPTSNDEQDSAIKYEDSDGNLFISVPFSDGGIPELKNQDNVLFNQNDTNYIVITYPNIDNYTKILNNEQTKLKEPWDFTYEEENTVNRFPDISFTTPPPTLFTDLINIPTPYYNIPDDQKYEFSLLNSIVPKEPVLLPYLSKPKKHKHNYYPKSHKNIVNHKTKYPYKNKPFNLQDVISDKYYNMISSKSKPYLESPQFLDKNITPKLTENVPNYEVYPNQLSKYVSEMPAKYKYYQPNILPIFQDTVRSPNHNTIATLPYANPLIYNKKPVPILESSKYMNPLKPNYYSLNPKGLLSNNKVHIILPNNMPILPKVFPKRVTSAQTPHFYLPNSILKFPEKNIFTHLYEYYYPQLSPFPQVSRNNPKPTTVSAILKFLKKIANNNPLTLFLQDLLNNDSGKPKNIDDYETDEATINHEHRLSNILPKLKDKNDVGSNYELPSYDYNGEYPVFSETSDNEYLKHYVTDLLPDLVSPGKTKFKNIFSSDDRILPKYKKKNYVDCVLCETFNKNINLLAKYLNNNHQQNDVMYLALKNVIKPLVQFVHKLILDENKLPSKIISTKPRPSLHSKDKKISVAPKFRPFNNKKKKNRYYPKNLKHPFNLNSISDIFYQNNSQPLSEKYLKKSNLNQYNSSPLETNHDYSESNKSQHSTLYNQYHKKQPKDKKQQPYGIAREDESVNSVPDQNLENYLDKPIEEEDSDEYSSYHKPILHKISSFESDPNRKVYLYQNPNAKFVEGPYLPKTGVNIKLYDKLHDSDEDPVLTDEFNLIPMGVPKPKQNSDEDYEERNDDNNTKSREFYDRIRIALHNKQHDIEPVYNTEIIHNHDKKPVTDHHIVFPTLYPEQVCSLCKTLNCNRYIPNNKQNNLHNLFSNPIYNHGQIELSKITAYAPYSNPTNSPLLDSDILSRLVRVLILNIIAESKSYTENKFQEIQFTNMPESSILSDIFSLLEYYQIMKSKNKPHPIYNLFQNALPIISSYNEIDTPSQPEFIPFQNDNNRYLDSIILNAHFIPDTTSNVILEILKLINQVNIESNNNLLTNLLPEKLKPCTNNLDFEANKNADVIPNHVESAVISLRSMLSKYKSLYQDLSALVIKNLKIHQSEEEPKKSMWSKPKTLLDKARQLPHYLNRFKPLSLRKILAPSFLKRPFSNHIVNYLKNIEGDKIHKFMPIKKSNNFGRHIKPKRNKKLNFINIYKTIKHAWEAYLSSNEDQQVKDYLYTKPKKYKYNTDLSLGRDKFPSWQETAYSGIRPVRGSNKPNQFIGKGDTNKYLDFVNAYNGKNKYPKPVKNKKSWQNYNDMPYDSDKFPFAKLWMQNPKHNIAERPDNFLNKRPTHYIEPFKGYTFKNIEPSKKINVPINDQFPFFKNNFKPGDKGTKNDDTGVFNDSGRPFKGHKYPAIESLKHAWKISNLLSSQGASISPKYLKPRGIKEEPHNISSNNHDLRPSLDDELLYPWPKQNVLSTKGQYSFANDLKPKEIQYPDLESIKNKRNPEIVLSKKRPVNHNYRNSIKYPWQKTIKPAGLGHLPFSKYLTPKELKHPDQSNQYKKLPDEFSMNYPFESYAHANEKPDILPDLGQLSSTENLNPTSKEIIKFPEFKQVSGEFYSKDPFEHHEQFIIQPGQHISEKPDGLPDLSSENLETYDKEIKYTSLKPIKYTDLLDEISNYVPFKSHEETYSKPSKHIFQSLDTSFVKGQLPSTINLGSQDKINEYPNEKAMKGKETADILFNQDHTLSSENSEPNGKDIKYSNLEPIKYKELLDDISNNAPFKSHEEIDSKPSKHIFQSPDTLFVKGQLPFTKYLNPQDNTNKYSNEEAMKGKQTADIWLDQDFKGRKLGDIEAEDNSWEKPEISSNQGVDWTAEDSNEIFWKKPGVANDNDNLEHSEPTGSEINISSTFYPLLHKRENTDDPNSDIAAILDYINKKSELLKKDPKDYDEPILEIDPKDRNARWADVTDLNIQRVSPNDARYEYAETPLIEDSDLT